MSDWDLGLPERFDLGDSAFEAEHERIDIRPGEKIYPRECQMCGTEIFVDAQAQRLMPPDHPFNLCKGCVNRWAALDVPTEWANRVG